MSLANENCKTTSISKLSPNIYLYQKKTDFFYKLLIYDFVIFFIVYLRMKRIKKTNFYKIVFIYKNL